MSYGTQTKFDNVIKMIESTIDDIRPYYMQKRFKVSIVKDDIPETHWPEAILVECDGKSMLILYSDFRDSAEVDVGGEIEEIFDGESFWRTFFIVSNLKD